MTRTWAAELHGPRDVRWAARSLAELAPTGVRVRLRAGGVCGSDLHYYRHGRSGDFVLRSPLVLGHEVAGQVEATGDEVEGLSAGDSVAINPARWCGRCRYCLAGRWNLCRDIFFLGSASRVPHMQGGFSEVFDVDAAQCHRVPATVPMSSLALSEPLAVALHAVGRAVATDETSSTVGRRPAEASAAVFGGGPIGLLILLALRRAGFLDVTVVDVADRPLALAAALGAKTVNSAVQRTALESKGGFDLVFEASGSSAGMADAIRAARPGGTLVQVGNLPAGDVPAPLNLIMSKELDLRGTFRFGVEFTEAVRLITEGVIDVAPLITETYPLSDAANAFENALDRSRNVKVMLEA